MKRRKILAVVLALVMTVCTTSAFAAGSFSDVADDAYYAGAVAWAAEQGITTGRGNGLFDPDSTVTRAEAVTFLWRMAGKPAPTQSTTFADVEADPGNGWYKAAVQWAVENGITNGTGTGFSPAVTCSRGMILTMLYRMEGNPWDEAANAAVPEDSESWTLDDLGNALVQGFIDSFRSEGAFADVKEGDYFELPVFWALLNQILDENQIDQATMEFRPAAPCVRGEMVYFLYRTSLYEAALRDSEWKNEPVEVGTIPETVLLDQDGVRITVNGIKSGDFGDAVLDLTLANGSDRQLYTDVGTLFVNTFSVLPSVYIPVEADGVTFYDSVIVPAGETRDFTVGLNYLSEKGINTVYEIELQMFVFEATETEDGWEYGEPVGGDLVTIRTSLYDGSVSYDLDGTTIIDKDGLKVLVWKAEFNEYMGPQIYLYAFNSGSETVSLDLAELKLDGEACDAFFSMEVPAGKRCVEQIYLDLDYENLSRVREGEITLRILDPETWGPKLTFDAVKFSFA